MINKCFAKLYYYAANISVSARAHQAIANAYPWPNLSRSSECVRLYMMWCVRFVFVPFLLNSKFSLCSFWVSVFFCCIRRFYPFVLVAPCLLISGWYLFWWFFQFRIYIYIYMTFNGHCWANIFDLLWSEIRMKRKSRAMPECEQTNWKWSTKWKKERLV